MFSSQYIKKSEFIDLIESGVGFIRGENVSVAAFVASFDADAEAEGDLTASFSASYALA